MNEDYKVKLKAELDTAEAERQIDNIGKNKKVKLTVDTGSTDKNIKNVDTQIRTAQKSSASFGDTLKKALNIGSSAAVVAKGFQLIRSAARDAKDAIKDFDAAITDVRTVTAKSYEDARNLVEGYNALGKTLGATTKEATDAGVTWLRQGKTVEEANDLIRQSMMLSKIGFVDSADAAEYLTSALNGYRLSAQDAASVVDKLAILDSSAAVTAGGLAEAMSPTAVSADNAGVSMDTLLGYIATTGEVTQQSMSSIGVFFKTLFARMRDIKANKLELIDDDGTTELLSDVELTLKNVGIDLRKTVTEFDDADKTLEALARKWNTLSSTQQAALSKAFGGVRNNNLFQTLMVNYDKVLKYTELSANSAGEAEKKFTAYLDSIEAKTKSLQAAFESLAFHSVSTEMIGGIMEAANALVVFLDKTNAVKGALAGIAAAGAIKSFTTITAGIVDATARFQEFNAALSIVNKGGITDNRLAQLTALTANLSTAQMKAVLSAKALSTEQRIAILTAQGMSTAEAKATLSTMGLATAEGTATAATGGLSGALKGLWATLMANPLVAIALAVGGAVAAITTYNKKVAEMRETAIKNGEAAQQEAKDLTKLKQAYDEANAAYHNNTGSKESLTNATNDLLRALGLERSEIEKLAGVYGGLDAAIQKVTADALKGKRIDLVKAYTSAEESLLTSHKVKGTTADFRIDDDSQRLLERLQERGLLTDAEQYRKRIFFDLAGNDESLDGILEMEQDAIRLKEVLQEIAKNIGWDTDRLIKTNLWKSIEEIYSADLASIIDTAEDAKNAVNENIASIAFLSGDFAIPKTADEFYNLRDALISATEADADFIGCHADAMKAVDSTLSLFSFTPQFASGYDEFKHAVKKLSDEAIKALTTTGTPPTKAVVDELTRWVNETGFTKPEFTNYFKQLASELSSAGDSLKESASSPIGNLVSLREELVGTTLALEDYKNAMKDNGEKGDSAKQYAEAWILAIDSINKGRVDSNAVREAGNLFFNEEQLAAMGYDLEKVGQALNSRLMQAIFATDENEEEQLDYGVKLANYIRENANLFAGVAGVSSASNGGFTFWYKSLEDLSRVLNIDAGAVSSLLDALDAFGIEAMRSTEESNELIQQFYSIQKAAGESGNAIRDFITALAKDGADNYTISQIITDLQSWGIIEDDVTNLGGLINEVRENLGNISEENPEATASLNTNPVYDALNDIDSALNEWANSVYAATATVNYVDGEQPSNSSPSSHGTVRPGTRTPGYSTGTRSAPGGEVLLNEKGPELVSDGGEAYIANGGKPGFANVGKGAVIFTAEDTKQIFSHTYRNIPVKAYANGTPETVNKSAIRDRLISGGNVKGLYTGGVSKTFTCVKCGHSWNYSPIDYPSGPTGACPKCGAYYSNGSYQYGGNTVAPEHQYDDYFGYDVTTGNPLDNYDNIYNNYVEHGYYGPQDSYYDSGYIHEKQCPNCGNAIAFNLVVCPHCGYNYATGKAQIKANQSINQGANNAKQENPKGSSGYVGNGGGSSVGRADYSSQAEPQKVDWISVLINRIQKAVAALEKIASSGFRKLSTRITAATGEVSELTKQIDANEQAYRRYIQEAESVGLSSDLEELVKDGTINIEEYDDETRKLIDSYSEWMEKAINAQYAVEELHQEIADIYQDIFDMTRTDYNNQLAVIEHDVNMLEKSMRLSQTRGYLDSAEYYKQLIDIENENISALNAELADLTAAFQNALNSGEIEAGSESFYDMRLSILGVEEALVDADNKLKEYAKTMRSIKWGYFDYAMDTFGQLQKEADFLISVMSNDKLFDDMGKFAEKGTATMGLRVMNYNAYMKQADEYAREMQEIERELAANPFDTELIGRRKLLLELQRQSIQAAESEKDAMKDLVSQGIQLEIDALKKLISEYEDSLSSARDLYTYQKKISEKTDDIAKIEKQLSAYRNDQSQENRARIQQLHEQLKKAREDLEETEWEQNIKDQKKLLDSLAEDYQEYMNTRLDDLESLVREMVDGVNVNAADIREELHHSAEQVGYSITDSMSEILESGTYAYYDRMFIGVTSVNSYLEAISRKIDEMITVADEAAKTKAPNQDTYPTGRGTQGGADSSTGKQNDTVKGYYDFASYDGDRLIEEGKPGVTYEDIRTGKLFHWDGSDYAEGPADSAVDSRAAVGTDDYLYDGSFGGQSVGSKGYKLKVSQSETEAELEKAGYGWVKSLGFTTASGANLEVLDKVLDEIRQRKPDVFNKLFTPYATGGLADYTGLAMLHGTKTKPELVLNASDTEKFLEAAKLMHTPVLSALSNKPFDMRMISGSTVNYGDGGINVGDININIERVLDYNDMLSQMRDDKRFERLVRAIAVEPLVGKSTFGEKHLIHLGR